MRRLLFLFLFLLPVTSYQPPTVDDRLIQAVVELTNEARAANGQPPLALNDALTAAAQLHAEAMAANDFFAHDNPLDGSTPGTRITAAGYAWQAVSENLGAGYDSAEEAVEGWLNSPEHRDNLLSADYQETGVGYFFQADDTFPAAGASYQTYWVQTFGAPAVSVQPTPAQGRLFARGDLLAAVSNGRINWYDAQGNLVKTLDTGFSGETTGMAFDSAGNLYVTNFDADTVSRFDNQGNLLGTFGGPYGESPESIVLDAEDRFYVGHADGDGDIRQFDQNGVPLAQFDVDTEDRGSDWIELADDQCTMFYTSEGQSIKRFDICANRQLPDFASGLNQTFALRILPDGGVIVANRQDVRHLSAAGEVVQAYDAPGEDCWFAVNRDPDGASFWSGDVCTGNVYQFSLDTGEVLLGPIDTCDSDCIGGVAIFGELIEAVPQTPTPDTPTPSPSPTPTSTPTPSPTPFPTELVTMTITADPVEASVDQSITVRITLSGDNSECGQSIVTKPVDVILVLDSSGSMEGTPLDQSKQAALAFVGQIDFAVDRVGIVQFSDKVDMVHPLDTSPAAVQAAINTIAITGGTAIDAGLQAAFEELQANLRPDATPVIVLLSDGGSDPSAAERVADTAKAAGMKIVTVGLGSSVDTGLLQAIASLDQNNQPQFYNSPDGSDLAAIYVTIAQSIREYGLAQDLTLRHQLGLYDFFVVPESLDPPGDIAGDTITWRKDVLEDGDTVFTFQVRPRGQGGEVDIGDLTEAIFLECEQTNRTIQLPPGPRVNIQAVPEEIPPVPFECAWWQVFPWWLLLPLLLLLLVLIFLFLTPWGRRLWRRLRAKPWLCKLLALLTLLYLLFLIGLIAYALLGHLCRADRVYFWKITDDGQRVAVFESRFGDDTARPVDSLNGEANCAACHAGSSQAQLVSAVRDDQNGPVTVQTVDGRDVPFPLVNGSYVAWSPDGAQAAISMNDQDIFILDAAAGTLTPLAGASEGDVIETMPTWSHDGQIIAFVRAARTAPDSPAAIDVPSDVYTVPAAGGVPLPLIGASGDGFNYYPAYSPDGRWLAFTRHTDGVDTYADDASDIYLVPAGGGERIFLTANSEAADSWPSWSPDGRWLGFSSNRRDGQYDVFLVTINEVGQSSGVYALPAAATSNDEEHHPVWIGLPQLAWWERLLPLWPWLLPLLLLLIAGWLVCRERHYTLAGRVVNAISREPIAGAEVKVTVEAPGADAPAVTSLSTDGAGQYRLLVPTSSVSVTAGAPNYVGQARVAQVKGDTTLDFRLYPLVEPRRVLLPPAPLAAWRQPPVWEPDPALIIGLGGTGRHVLTHLKKNLRDAGAGVISDKVRLVLFDTADFELLAGEEVPVSFAGVTLTNEDIVEFGEDLSSLIQPGADVEPEIRDWFPAADYRTRLAPSELDLSVGTRQRRPPARAALVRDVRQGHASRLWQLLLREAQAALDKDNHLRVILVGSLAGGFGSATVADLAYLAHRAGQALKVEGGTSIEAYLATDGAFGRVANRPDVQAANTYASLRELERFQLAQGYPFRMVYRYEAAGDPQLGEVLAGAINRRLLDELYLFDTSPEIEPANEAQSQAYYEPAASIFPAMADAISLWLDKASRRGALNAYRRGIEADVTREQQARRRAVVGGLGTFVYRLPMYDLVAQLKARWARALLHQLVTGDPAAPLRLDAAQNREEDPRAIGDHVHQFLIGLAGYEQPPCPTTTALIGTLAHEGISLTLREKIGQTPPGQPEAEVPLYRSYLAGALQVILNGQASSQVSVARGGKLGYALDFLREVDGALARAAEEANLVPPDLPAEVSQALEQLFNLLPHLRAESQAIVATLQQQAGLLSRRLRGGRTAAEGAPGLLEQLEEWEAECTGRLAEMDAVLVRQYIHPAGLINQWYKTYLTDSPFVAEALQRLHWQVGPDGRLALAVRAWQTDSTILAASEANQRTFLDQLLQLAAYATQDIWQNETLATVLAQTALHPERIEDTVQRLRIGSEPLLRHNPDKASQAKLGVLLGVNETVDQAKRLEKALRTQLTSDRKLSGVAITDPYTLLLGQTIDVIPLDAIDSLANAEQTYHRWYGLLPNAPADPRAEPTAVFRAEKIALLLEQRLQPELRQAARLLRPVVVTALDSGGVARLYALALAAGWVQRTHTGLRLRLPGSPEAALGEQAGDQLHPYLLGLVQFAAQATPAQVRAIQTAVSQAGPETIEAWRTWAGPAWTQHPLAAELLAAGPDAADLAAVVALVTRDEVQRRN